MLLNTRMLRSIALLAMAVTRLVAEQNVTREAVERVRPALVQLRYVASQRQALAKSTVVATGMIVQPEQGLILTSTYGLVPDPPLAITVLDATGETKAAKLLGVDHHRQLALLSCATPLPTTASVSFANPSEVHPGQTSIAVGCVFKLDQPTISTGVVSALNRLGGIALQTDAAVSPTNYGGPLLSSRGELLGILAPLSPDNDVRAAVEWYDSGIGFAVPAEQFLPRISQLQAGETIRVARLPLKLVKGSPLATPAKLAETAESQGLQEGDEIIGIAGRRISSQWQLQAALGACDAGQSVPIAVRRKTGAEESLMLELSDSKTKPTPQ
jgi:S1-C subfamily serine protease